jgi:YidC/Oxa1 family membrane protein insertase
LEGSISKRGLIFNNLILKEYKKEINSNKKVKLLASVNDSDAYFVEFGWDSDDKKLELPNINTLWKANKNSIGVNETVIFSYKNKDKIEFQLIVFIDENYMFNFKQNVVNNTDNAINIRVSNKINRKIINEQPAKLSVDVHEGFIGAFGNGIEEISYIKLKKKENYFDAGFLWAGFTDKYWLVSFAPNLEQKNNFTVNSKYSDNVFNLTFRGDNVIVNPNEIYEVEENLFSGPKILSLLDEYSSKYHLPLFDRNVDFGWFYFLTKPIYMLLKTFYNFIGNFGVAILLLTFLVKGLMYPFTKKSYISIARMKRLQPKIILLKERYANDKMKMNQELIQLYKKENISPLSGCLPMLIQIPVFFSLYKVLVISIDMRQANFIGYIKNLAVEDPTTIWNLFGLLPYNISFFPIGLLPCLMALTMWIQQKMTTRDDTNKEAQMITRVMPIIFLFMFNKMPSGLLIYWVFSNIISIAQQYYVEKKIVNK